MSQANHSGRPILAWHFVHDTLRDGSPIPPDGVWLRHEGECVMCERGLHASRRLIDALQYAPGSTICRVAVDDIVEEQSDKLVCKSRLILWRLKAQDDLLRAFARKLALSVIHLWNAPDVVRQYLETGDENLRAAAGDAAGAAAGAAAWAAAKAAVGAAAGAAWAAWAADWDAAGAAAGDAAGAAAWAAARAAVRAAAGDAAGAAAGAAARAAARDTTYAKFDTDLEAIVLSARGNPDDQSLLTLASKRGR